MAISLEQTRKSKKDLPEKTIKTPLEKKVRARQAPWSDHAAGEEDASDVLELRKARELGLDWSLGAPQLDLPEMLDAKDLWSWLKQWRRQSQNDLWRELQRRSYWLSRLTYQAAWIRRVKLSPKLQLPLPSWLTQSDHAARRSAGKTNS